ncbi:DNA-binding response OmpR family regulator [Mycoplana sp. BE70]|nr:DNA-binding response OmpR family regulator [Mycoplana sp. BE70]
MRILVVEDDAVLLDGLKVGLGLSGFTVDTVATRADATEALMADRFDAVVLDRMLPDGSGLEVLAHLRERGDRTPVLLLTAKDETADRIDGLDAGADDYLGKPFDLDEVAARLRAITRRAEGRARPELRCGGIVLDPAEMAARKGDISIPLSR